MSNLKRLLRTPTAATRLFMMTIDKNYLKKKLAKRTGKCLHCGDCCVNCHFLDSGKLCKVYSNRPFLCYKEFPVGKFDQYMWNVRRCGYEFNE
ncbi:MAG: hypothetical protein ABSF44_13550 [Candidatus Bathyarchaeia archaeon]